MNNIPQEEFQNQDDNAISEPVEPKTVEDMTVEDIETLVKADDDDETIEWNPPQLSDTELNLAKMCAKFPATDYGNAQRLLLRYGHIIRFAWQDGKYVPYVYGRGVWKRNDVAQLQLLGMDTIQKIKNEYYFMNPEKTKGGVKVAAARLKFSTNCENRDRDLQMIRKASILQGLQGIRTSPDDFDRQSYFLNVDNGTIDLRDGKIKDADTKDLLSKQSPIKYNPDAKCPKWDKFLKQITCWEEYFHQESDDLIHYLQVTLGYFLTGENDYHRVWIASGEGRNGKNTLISMYEYIAELYTYVAPSGFFNIKAGERHPESTMHLKGSRLFINSETDQTVVLDEGKLCDYTGGGRITARHMNKESETFKPTHKTWLMTNTLPTLKTNTKGMKSRMIVIPFNMKLGVEDPFLPAELAKEAEGILAWMVRGAVEYYEKRKLPVCAAVTKASREYLDDQDTIGQWANDCFELSTDPHDCMTNRQLLTYYNNWMIESGYAKTGVISDIKKLTPTLTRLGYISATGVRNHGERGRGFTFLKIKDTGAHDDIGTNTAYKTPIPLAFLGMDSDEQDSLEMDNLQSLREHGLVD